MPIHAIRMPVRPSKAAKFDVLVLTESVEIKDAIKYHDSPKYIRKWARAARTANPQTRVYLYEVWHELNDPKGWLERLDEDLGLYWEGVLLAQGLAHGDTGGPVYVIPAGQVMARLVREVEARGGVDRLRVARGSFLPQRKGGARHDPPERAGQLPDRPDPLCRAVSPPAAHRSRSISSLSMAHNCPQSLPNWRV